MTGALPSLQTAACSPDSPSILWIVSIEMYSWNFVGLKFICSFTFHVYEFMPYKVVTTKQEQKLEGEAEGEREEAPSIEI